MQLGWSVDGLQAKAQHESCFSLQLVFYSSVIWILMLHATNIFHTTGI